MVMTFLFLVSPFQTNRSASAISKIEKVVNDWNSDDITVTLSCPTDSIPVGFQRDQHQCFYSSLIAETIHVNPFKGQDPCFYSSLAADTVQFPPYLRRTKLNVPILIPWPRISSLLVEVTGLYRDGEGNADPRSRAACLDFGGQHCGSVFHVDDSGVWY